MTERAEGEPGAVRRDVEPDRGPSHRSDDDWEGGRPWARFGRIHRDYVPPQAPPPWFLGTIAIVTRTYHFRCSAAMPATKPTTAPTKLPPRAPFPM
jgi:hypothetical protein